ncbi:MAG: hypothetical protein ABI390_10800 [Daejeonella sp.]
MKTLLTKSAVFCVAIAAFTFSSCIKDQAPEIAKNEIAMSECVKEIQMGAGESSVSASSPYAVRLASVTKTDAGWEWVWTVQNFHPGNGSNGTVQDLSHWDIDLGTCVTTSDIVSSSVSTNGNTWTANEVAFKQDKSQDCYNNSIFKFNLGTAGSAVSYYKIVLNKAVAKSSVLAVYKSGKNTGCGIFETCGFGCPSL